MSRYTYLTAKRYVEQIIMFPFVLLGRIIYLCNKKNTDYDVFFFLPIHGVGGAEYINAKILSAIPNKKIHAIFTKKSKDKTSLHLFHHENVTISDISKWTDNKYIYFCNFICRGYYAEMIKRNHKKSLVFIAQCNFAYKLTPHIQREIKVIELIHLYDRAFCNVWLPFLRFINTRLSFSSIEIEKINTYAKNAGAPVNIYDKFIELTPFADVPQEYKKVSRNDSVLRVFYAGRGTQQKRLWLNFEIARLVKNANLPVSFYYVGNFQDELPNDIDDIATYMLPINSGNDLYDFIKEMDVLLLTSETEGFPVILLESMHFGIVPVVTPVGEMKNAIINNENGILLENTSEESVVSSGFEAVKRLCSNHDLYNHLSDNIKNTYNSKYKKEIFDSEIVEILTKN